MKVIDKIERPLSPQAVQAKLDQALDQHDVFLSKVELYESVASQTERQSFLRELKAWFAELRPLSSQIQTTDQYSTLTTIAFDWQTTLASKLRYPLNVWDELGLTMPSADLKPRRRHATESQIRQLINDRAYEAATTRKLSQLSAEIEFLARNSGALHAKLPSTHQQCLEDWHHACLFIAADVLAGRIRLSDQLPEETFEYLQSCWLEETKQLMAYFRWLERARRVDSGKKNPRGDDYYDVCEQLHGRLLDPQAKAPVVLFRKIEIWLGKHYLRKGRLDLGHGSPARRLVEQKAHRVWQRTGRQDSQANWDTALHYASAFYENIVPAINEHDAGSVQQVLHALSPVLEPGTGCELVNSFEAAIVIEFLAPADIKAAYHPASSYL